MNIAKYKPPVAWDLLYTPCLAMLSEFNRDTMHRAVFNSTFVWIGEHNGEIFGFWGLIPPTLFSDRAYLWFYSTEHLCKCIIPFIRHSRRVTTELLEHYSILVGHGRIDAPKSLRWLAWCGAEFGEPQGPLIPFEIRGAI
jgi:hypothetical protein